MPMRVLPGIEAEQSPENFAAFLRLVQDQISGDLPGPIENATQLAQALRNSHIPARLEEVLTDLLTNPYFTAQEHLLSATFIVRAWDRLSLSVGAAILALAQQVWQHAVYIRTLLAGAGKAAIDPQLVWEQLHDENFPERYNVAAALLYLLNHDLLPDQLLGLVPNAMELVTSYPRS